MKLTTPPSFTNERPGSIDGLVSETHMFNGYPVGLLHPETKPKRGYIVLGSMGSSPKSLLPFSCFLAKDHDAAVVVANPLQGASGWFNYATQSSELSHAIIDANPDVTWDGVGISIGGRAALRLQKKEHPFENVYSINAPCFPKAIVQYLSEIINEKLGAALPRELANPDALWERLQNITEGQAHSFAKTIAQKLYRPFVREFGRMTGVPISGSRLGEAKIQIPDLLLTLAGVPQLDPNGFYDKTANLMYGNEDPIHRPQRPYIEAAVESTPGLDYITHEGGHIPASDHVKDHFEANH